MLPVDGCTCYDETTRPCPNHPTGLKITQEPLIIYTQADLDTAVQIERNRVVLICRDLTRDFAIKHEPYKAGWDAALDFVEQRIKEKP